MSEGQQNFVPKKEKNKGESRGTTTNEEVKEERWRNWVVDEERRRKFSNKKVRQVEL